MLKVGLMLTLWEYYTIQAFLYNHVQSTCSTNTYRQELIVFFHLTAAKSRLVQLSVSSCFGLHCELSTETLAILLRPHWFFHCVCQFGILVSCHQLACTEREDTLTMCFFCVIMRTFISGTALNDRIEKKNSHTIKLIVRFWMFSPDITNKWSKVVVSVHSSVPAEWLDLLPGCTIKTNLVSFKKRVRAKKTIWEISHNIRERTKLTQVQAEIGSLHQAGVLTHGPNVEVHEDGQAGEGCHSEPHQEEQVGQEHQLQTQTVCWALTMRHKWAGDGKKVPFSVLSTTVLQL